MDRNERRGSQPIGSLMAKTVNTLQSGDGTRQRLPTRETHSATTTSPSRRLPQTGTHRGVPGSAISSVSLPAIVAKPELLADLHRNPAKFLPPSTRSAIAEMWADGDTGNGWDGYVRGYQLARPISENEREAALAFAEESLRPASEDFILAELGRLRALTVSRDIGQDLALVFAAYADELAQYPADAVREVLRGWRGKFWPTWAELVDRLDRIVAPRKALMEALRRGYREPEHSPEWTPPTEEQKREVLELLAKNGIRLDERGRVRPMERAPMTAADRQRMDAELAEFRARWAAVTARTASAA